MKFRWLAPLAALVWLGCGKGNETPAGSRTAAVASPGTVEKAPAPPPEIKTVEKTPAPEPVKAATVEPLAKAEPVKTEPPKEEPVKTEPAKEEPVAKEEPAKEAPVAKEEPVAKEPAKEEPAKVESGSSEALAPDLMVMDAAVTNEIVDRMPAERKTSWKIGEDPKLIGWFEFKNPAGKVDVELVWKKNGTVNWRFPTSVGVGKNWRTWAEKRITKKDAGNWSVEVVDANGHVYESITYTVE